MNEGYELLEVSLRKEFEGLKKFPIRDRRRIILFALLVSEVSSQHEAVTSPASQIGLLDVALRLTGSTMNW